MNYMRRANMLLARVSPGMRQRLVISRHSSTRGATFTRATVAGVVGVAVLGLGGVAVTRGMYADAANATTTLATQTPCEQAAVVHGYGGSKDCGHVEVDDDHINEDGEVRKRKLKHAQIESQKLIDALMVFI